MEQFIEALEYYCASKKELDKCVSSCENDPSYWCNYEYRVVEESKEKLKDALNQPIDNRIKEILGDR